MADESADNYASTPTQFQEEDLCAVWVSSSESSSGRSSVGASVGSSGRSSVRSLSDRFSFGHSPFLFGGRGDSTGMEVRRFVVFLLRFLSTGLLATGSLVMLLRISPLPPHRLLALCLLIPLLYTIRWFGFSRSRLRPLTFMPPLVFGAVLWFHGSVAGIGALITCWLYAIWGEQRPSARVRSLLYWQGFQYLCACSVAQIAMEASPKLLHAPLRADQEAVDALIIATLGAISFVASLSLLYTLAYAGTLLGSMKRAANRTHLGHLALVMALGLFPVLFVAPFQQAGGLLVGLPILLLLSLVGRMVHLQETSERLRKQLRASEAMGRASLNDSESVDGGLLLQRFLALAHELVPSERALIWILNQETGQLMPEVALPDKGPFLRRVALFGEGLIGHVATRMAPRIVADASVDPHRGVQEQATGAWLLYPMVVHEQLLGVAHWTRPVSRPFSHEDIASLDALVPQAAIALENIYIRARMHDLASTDGLTGLWNHRHMISTLRDELRRAARYHRTISILMMDVDSFKTFNDTYGHPQGDRLLRTFGQILKQSVRSVDHVGRYGGEEFMMILPETGKDDACRLAERLRSTVENQAYILVDGRAIHRTISIGVASYPEDALNPEELVQRADEALYRAKRAGKNCVIWS